MRFNLARNINWNNKKHSVLWIYETETEKYSRRSAVRTKKLYTLYQMWGMHLSSSYVRMSVRPIRQGKTFLHIKKMWSIEKEEEEENWNSWLAFDDRKCFKTRDRNRSKKCNRKYAHQGNTSSRILLCSFLHRSALWEWYFSVVRWVEDFTSEIRKRLRVIIKGDSMENNLLLPFVF